VRKFSYKRQVTHNSHLYENQDFNVLKITNLTFKTDIIIELPTEIFGYSSQFFFFDLTVASELENLLENQVSC
jgi:hypothetical protein